MELLFVSVSVLDTAVSVLCVIIWVMRLIVLERTVFSFTFLLTCADVIILLVLTILTPASTEYVKLER